jgi:hypothetical protein
MATPQPQVSRNESRRPSVVNRKTMSRNGLPMAKAPDSATGSWDTAKMIDALK